MSVGNVNFELENSFVGMGIRKVSQIVNYDDFTDGGSTTGTLTMTKQIPAGSFVLGSKVTVKDGFTGDTTATLKIGKSGDDDAYSGGTTHNIVSAASNLVKAAKAGTDLGPVAEGSAVDVVLTVTGASDFTSISAGRMLVEVFYLSTNVELTDSGRNKSDL
ncbi:MAG: hypothetical protein JRI56_00275 [Deltaproteobacteria bacterium]|nr:hypothetical protein [Deltaproteobacteria bacterium]